MKTSAFTRAVLAACVIAGFAAVLPLRAQETAKYSAEEYKAYQAVPAETDSAKKMVLIVAFVKTYPTSELRPHVYAAYQSMMTDLQKGQQWSALISAGEKYLDVAPDDMFTLAMMVDAYQQTKNHKQFVAFAEKTYAKKPTGNLAYYIAKAYIDLNNDAAFLTWGEKAVTHLPDNHEILLELAKRNAVMGKTAAASKFSKQCIKALQGAKKPEGVADDAWKSYTATAYGSCYAIVGNVAYEQKDYGTAVANLENSVKFVPRNDLAYYYLGLSYWQLNKVDIAMLNLAKAYLLRGKSSSAAKQHLDNLYKSTHHQSLVGQERVIARAKELLRQ